MMAISVVSFFLFMEVVPCFALTHFELPTAAPYFDLKSQFAGKKGTPQSLFNSQKNQYCVSIAGKLQFLSDLESWQGHNFSRLRSGTWLNYVVSIEKAGIPKYLGFEKWKIVSVSQDTGQARAWVLDTDGNTAEVIINRADLTHEGVRPDLNHPTTCLLQDTLVGRIQRGQRKAMAKQWDTLQYFRSPLSSNEQIIDVAQNVPLGFLYVKEEKGAETVVRELDGFHW